MSKENSRNSASASSDSEEPQNSIETRSVSESSGCENMELRTEVFAVGQGNDELRTEVFEEEQRIEAVSFEYDILSAETVEVSSEARKAVKSGAVSGSQESASRKRIVSEIPTLELCEDEAVLEEDRSFPENEDELNGVAVNGKTFSRVPPQEIPGYEFDRYLGSGAYGEVWIALQVSTARRVAVKFYTHKNQNIEFLTQEVEKLSLLFSDQNVVQLLEVGWSARVPYYIMEYLENGSLADVLSQRKFTLSEAQVYFETLLLAMCRAHQKGIIHCDLKPGNILLDQNQNLRLADFGQSRLGKDMAPALGTLFYMPPEQAQLKAHADVRWDIYALGAIFYTMLMGRPPHYAPAFVDRIQEQKTLSGRLRAYRTLLLARPIPVDHRQLRGMSPRMAQILEKCLEPDPENRFQTMEELLADWKLCQKRSAKYPLFILGIILPVLLILVSGLFAVSEFRHAFRNGERFIMESTLRSTKFAADAVAKNVESEIYRRRSMLEELAGNWQFSNQIMEMERDVQCREYVFQLGRDDLDEAQRLQIQTEFSNNFYRLRVQEIFENSISENFKFTLGDDLMFCDRHGITCARSPFSGLVGKNFLPYFHRAAADSGEIFLAETILSDVFLHPVTNQWSVAILTPVFSPEEEPMFLGVLFMSVGIGNFVMLENDKNQFAVLVDQRPGESKGLILEHPLYDQLAKEEKMLPASFREKRFRVTSERMPNTPVKARNYFDPLSESEYADEELAQRWLAACADVDLGTAGKWTVITQTSYQNSVGAIFEGLQRHFCRVAQKAIVVFLIIIGGVWFYLFRVAVTNQEK
ncbi:MAG: protein kinase [Thermoguttaceae bacterium]|nr:protein kinase [Thermoguttaceae bacterium]